MKRDLKTLTEREVDLLVVGGGIFGASAAWDATQRGLSVAMIERSDFCGATSANSYKLIHGGIRYVQHLDVGRVRHSSHERRAFLRIAPHLTRPLRILIPTFGRGMRGKLVLRAGTALYDLLTSDRNAGIADSSRRVPRSRIVSKQELLEWFPDLASQNPTGAAMIADGQMYNPPRLVLAFVRAAAEAGAKIANYVEARSFLRENDVVRGVLARDLLGREDLSIRAKVVLNAAGPYAEELLSSGLSAREPGIPLSRDACFVVQRQLTPPDIGLAVQGASVDPDAILGRGERHLFVVPWRGCSVIGVWHKVYRESTAKRLAVSEEEIEKFLAEVNAAAPWLRLDRDHVSMVNAGLVPFGDNPRGATNLRYGHRSRLIDHASTEGLEGLISLVGVRFTTGRREASRAVDLVFRKLGHSPPECRTAVTPVWGGEIDDLEDCVRSASRQLRDLLSDETARALVHNYGSSLAEVTNYFQGDASLAAPIGRSTTLKAEVVHAVRDEMALKLSDVIFRRTDLGTAGLPSDDEVEIAAGLMGAEAGWEQARVLEEIAEVRRFPILANR